MIEFFHNEAVSYTLVVVAVILLVFALRAGAKHYANTKLALLMLSVEKKLTTWAQEQSASGEDKRKHTVEMIAERVYPLIPFWAKVFITTDFLEKQIDRLYIEMLDYLDDGVSNDSVV